ncbi:hypothetical protein ACFQI3_14210 [Hansschlegelia quercus]|uniref:Helix-turn-helix domain-containing protein n=1 Tax=Hansschlegelia quercus TaxID=2528245 RepID=A0A4Q9GBU1_9HYPH|nr:hypothetical protein [Hansschlegelia quercus]TBN48646.1 hypothetical protein EYR15_13745 [Hansschlegelia quercus]
MPALISHTDDEIARARTLYEETNLSPKDIAKILGIGDNTFFRRVKAWGWRRRRLRVAEVDAAALEAAGARDEALRTLGREVIDHRLAAEDRAEDAILGQIAALEAMRERVAVAAYSTIDSERGARTLYRLAQALTEIARARNEKAKLALASRNDDRPGAEPEDLDAMRNMLADRLERLRAQFEGDAAYEDAAPRASGEG